MDIIFAFLFALLPAFLFLIFLFVLDSFKLVLIRFILLALGWGVLCTVIAYYLNNLLVWQLSLTFNSLSIYLAPATEELLKIVFIIVLIKLKRIGFMIDAVIYGFAVGAGFALAENVFYLYTNNDPNLLVWIIRGLGTSIMHGGCTALFALIVVGVKSRNSLQIVHFFLAFVVAYLIHSVFNHFFITPILQTAGIVIILPLLFITIFNINERQLQNWLEIEFANEVELLKMINKGQFLNTKAGEYLNSLKTKFKGEVILDMYCFISLYLELSIKAKRNIMLKESGFEAIVEPDLQRKLYELRQLRKQIGKTAEITLSPLIKLNYRSLWKLKILE